MEKVKEEGKKLAEVEHTLAAREAFILELEEDLARGRADYSALLTKLTMNKYDGENTGSSMEDTGHPPPQQQQQQQQQDASSPVGSPSPPVMHGSTVISGSAAPTQNRLQVLGVPLLTDERLRAMLEKAEAAQAARGGNQKKKEEEEEEEPTIPTRAEPWTLSEHNATTGTPKVYAPPNFEPLSVPPLPSPGAAASSSSFASEPPYQTDPAPSSSLASPHGAASGRMPVRTPRPSSPRPSRGGAVSPRPSRGGGSPARGSLFEALGGGGGGGGGSGGDDDDAVGGRGNGGGPTLQRQQQEGASRGLSLGRGASLTRGVSLTRNEDGSLDVDTNATKREMEERRKILEAFTSADGMGDHFKSPDEEEHDEDDDEDDDFEEDMVVPGSGGGDSRRPSKSRASSLARRSKDRSPTIGARASGDNSSTDSSSSSSSDSTHGGSPSGSGEVVVNGARRLADSRHARGSVLGGPGAAKAAEGAGAINRGGGGGSGSGGGSGGGGSGAGPRATRRPTGVIVPSSPSALEEAAVAADAEFAFFQAQFVGGIPLKVLGYAGRPTKSRRPRVFTIRFQAEKGLTLVWSKKDGLVLSTIVSVVLGGGDGSFPAPQQTNAADADPTTPRLSFSMPKVRSLSLSMTSRAAMGRTSSSSSSGDGGVAPEEALKGVDKDCVFSLVYELPKGAPAHSSSSTRSSSPPKTSSDASSHASKSIATVAVSSLDVEAQNREQRDMLARNFERLAQQERERSSFFD